MTWAGQAVDNLYLAVVNVENGSGRDFENVVLELYTDGVTQLLTERTSIEGTPSILQYSPEFQARIAVAPGQVATPRQVDLVRRSREYLLPVFNRDQRLRLTYLCTRPGDQQVPYVFVHTTLKGAKLVLTAESNLFQGAPIQQAVIWGATTAFAVFLACGFFVRNVWAASSIAMIVALNAQFLGAYQFRMGRWIWRRIAG